MPGIVFKMEFRVLAREFEFINTSPGYAWLLGENWVLNHKKINKLYHVGKKLSNDKSLEVNVAIVMWHYSYPNLYGLTQRGPRGVKNHNFSLQIKLLSSCPFVH